MMNKIEIGKIVGPHGLKGETKVYPYSSEEAIYSLEYFYLDNGDTLKVKSFRKHKNIYLYKFENIEDINQVELLRDTTLYIELDKLPRLQDDIYIYEILGFEVFDLEGNTLGFLKEIANYGASDVYILDYNETEKMIPVIKEFIDYIDFDKNIINLKIKKDDYYEV